MNIHRLIYPGFWFGKTRKQDAYELAARGVGGFCIYGGTLQEVQDLAQELRARSPLPHLFLCADYEDGLGRWIAGQSRVLSNLAVGASQDLQIAYQKGLTLAREARKVGIDWVFAPVLDLCDEPQNPIVNIRSFGDNPFRAGALGQALCRGLKDGAVLNSIKHFPGHGQTTQDSHLALPVLTRSAAQLQNKELIAFEKALPQADSVMVGHLLIPQLDAQNPASLSAAVITHLLKQKMGFTKLVFTDALCMKAIGDEKQAALQALHAGAHILLAAEDSLALADFLQKQKGLEKILAQSVLLQQQAISSLTKTPRQGLRAEDFNQKYAARCAVGLGDFAPLQTAQTAAYMELGNDEHLRVEPFLKTLQQNGIRLLNPPQKAEVLLAVCFSNYKAFKGRINLSKEEKQKLAQAKEQYPQTIFVSFASPFGTEDIPSLSGRLFLFSPADEAQICAAEILTGQKKPEGKIPFGY